MIPTRIFFQIHDSRRLLMTYSFKDFLSGYLSLVLYSFFWCPNVCFHTQNYVDFSTTVFLYHLSFCSDMDLFVTQRMHEGHTPLGKNLEIELSETPYPAFPGSNAINSYTCILSRFSQSLLIHGSQA